MAVTFRAASGGQSSTTANAASVTQPAGATTKDLVIVGLDVKDSQTFTAKSGWTLEQNANSGGNVSTTATYRRVLDGTESWPISFAWTGTAVKYAWVAAAFTPGAGNQMTVDGEAAVKVDTSTATTHTANAQTAVSGAVCSVIVNCGRQSSSGSTGATVTAPTNYTEPTNGDQTTASGTTTALSQVGVEVCYRTGLSGTVTPTAATWTLSVTANVYHFLITDANLTGTAGLATATATAQAASVPKTSPALELSSFGSFAPIASGATITDVTATVSQFSSSALMAAPTYELWDGTSAIIGTAQTGTASTTSTHTDTVVFTGVTFSQIGTLRLRIYAHSGTAASGQTLSVDAASLTIRYMPGVGTTAPAGLATATATAQAATVPGNVIATAGLATATASTGTGTLAGGTETAIPAKARPGAAIPGFPGRQLSTHMVLPVTGNARLATASASAQFTPGTSVSILAIADTPVTATATALNATVSTSGGTTATAGLATATAAAEQTAQHPAGLATATATALQTTQEPIGLATATATAQSPSSAILVNAGLPTAAGTALQTAQHPAGLATATATALNATVTTSGNTVATAGLATAAGTAQPGTVTTAIVATAGLATAAGTALNAAGTTAITANAGAATAAATAWQTAQHPAGLATATAAALNATANTSGSTTATAGLATATGTAAGIGHGTIAGLATATGTAQAAQLAILARAAAAQALAAALDATVPPPFTVGTLTASDAPGGSGGVLTASDTRTGGPS